MTTAQRMLCAGGALLLVALRRGDALDRSVRGALNLTVPPSKERLTRNRLVNRWIFFWLTWGLIIGLPLIFFIFRADVLDRAGRPLKTDLVHALGGVYHADRLPPDLQVDIVIECTASSPLILEALRRPGGNGIVCLTGVSSSGRPVPFDVGAFNRAAVLQNDVVFGSVNANRRHYEMGATSLAAADPAWLARLITRRVPLARWPEAFERRAGDIKVVLQFVSDPA